MSGLGIDLSKTGSRSKIGLSLMATSSMLMSFMKVSNVKVVWSIFR